MYYVFTTQDDCIGYVTEPEAAALLAEHYGDGSYIRASLNGPRVWTQGNEGTTASKSFDECAELILDRVTRHASKVHSL